MAIPAVTPPLAQGGLSRLAASAVGAVRKAGEAAVSFLLPQSGPAAQAATDVVKSAGDGTKAIAAAAAGTIEAAGAGVRKGLTIGYAIAIGLLALYVFGLLRRATGE